MTALEQTFLLQALTAGVVATALMDAWALVLAQGFGLPVTNWAMVGRWVGHLRSGRLVHRPIADSPSVPNERTLGWAVHYAVGIAYAFLYLFIVQTLLSSSPTMWSAGLFGLLTLAAPWLVLQPGLGLGICARHAPRPGLIRGISVSMHVVFGLALFVGWRLAA